MPGEWVTTNGFDAIFFLSDGSRMEITEQPNEVWELTHFVGATGVVLFSVKADNRFPLMKQARELYRALGLRTVPSEEQRTSPWFKGDEAEYTTDERGERQYANGLKVITPEDRAARIAAIKSVTAHVVVNDPLPGEPNLADQIAKAVPEPAAAPPDDAAMKLAMAQAAALTALLAPPKPPTRYTCSSGHTPNSYGGGPTCPECGSWGTEIK